jgi:hypothetical protein
MMLQEASEISPASTCPTASRHISVIPMRARRAPTSSLKAPVDAAHEFVQRVCNTLEAHDSIQGLESFGHAARDVVVDADKHLVYVRSAAMRDIVGAANIGPSPHVDACWHALGAWSPHSASALGLAQFTRASSSRRSWRCQFPYYGMHAQAAAVLDQAGSLVDMLQQGTVSGSRAAQCFRQYVHEHSAATEQATPCSDAERPLLRVRCAIEGPIEIELVVEACRCSDALRAAAAQGSAYLRAAAAIPICADPAHSGADADGARAHSQDPQPSAPRSTGGASASCLSSGQDGSASQAADGGDSHALDGGDRQAEECVPPEADMHVTLTTSGARPTSSKDTNAVSPKRRRMSRPEQSSPPPEFASSVPTERAAEFGVPVSQASLVHRLEYASASFRSDAAHLGGVEACFLSQAARCVDAVLPRVRVMEGVAAAGAPRQSLRNLRKGLVVDPAVQRLVAELISPDCSRNVLNVNGLGIPMQCAGDMHALLLGLRENRSVKVLFLCNCGLQEEHLDDLLEVLRRKCIVALNMGETAHIRDEKLREFAMGLRADTWVSYVYANEHMIGHETKKAFTVAAGENRKTLSKVTHMFWNPTPEHLRAIGLGEMPVGF